MAAPQVRTVPVVFFGRHVVQLPFRAQEKANDTISSAVKRLAMFCTLPDELAELLRRYPHHLLTYFSFQPIDLQAAQAEAASNCIKMEGKKARNACLLLLVYEGLCPPSTVSLSVEPPHSIGSRAREHSLAHVPYSKDWYDFLHDRGLSEKLDARFNSPGCNAMLVVWDIERARHLATDHGPHSVKFLHSNSECTSDQRYCQSYVVKFAIPPELEVHEHLENLFSCNSTEMTWPASLCKIIRSIPSEPLPHDLAIIFFPNYGTSMHGAWHNPEEVLAYSTLWECTYHLVSAIEFLHSHNIAHLDIKPANVTLQVIPCDIPTHLNADSWYPGWHMHPRLTLLDLGSAVLGLDHSQLLDRPSGTSGSVAPEVQAYFGPVSVNAWALPTPPYDPWRKQSKPRPPTPEPEKIPYNPYAADVWGVGHVFKCMANVVTDPVHRLAMLELGERIMRKRPSAEVREGREAGGRSALMSMLQQVEREYDLFGKARVAFAVAAVKDNSSERLLSGPVSPFY